MPADKGSRVIFIGNIPYGLTEEQITHIFGSVGTVNSFRLVYDKESGRPKGFGFLEFSDSDSAASAVRNLNDHEIMNRRLRVDYSNDGGTGDSAPNNYNQQQQQAPQQQYQPPPMQSADPFSNGTHIQSLPPLPPGVDLPANLTCPDAISRTLSTLPPPQLLDIISQMKGLVMTDPSKATELFRGSPQLAYAIFQSLLLLGLVDTSVLAQVVESAAQQPAAYAPPPPLMPPQQQPPPQMQQHAALPYGNPAPLAGFSGAPHPQLQHFAPPQHQLAVPTPPQQQQAYAPPPMQQQQQGPGQLAAAYRQVLSMTQEQIDAYPIAERGQLNALRQGLLSGAIRL